MRDCILLGITAILAVTFSYCAYTATNPGGDGAIFATVAGTIVGIVTFIIGRLYGSKETQQ